MDQLVQKAAEVKDRHIQFLMSLPAVEGAGIGLSKKHPGKAVIQLFVSRRLRDKERRLVPKALEGVPVETIETGPFRARETSKKKKAGPANSVTPGAKTREK